MKLNIKCPNCNKNLIINIKNNKIISVEIDDSIKTNKQEISEVLFQHGIEFG